MGDDKSPHQLLVKSKKNRKGEWITPRAEQNDSEYQKWKSQYDPSSQMTDDEFRLYLEADGGFDKKMRVFGVGDFARELFTTPPGPTSWSSQSSQPTEYTPSVVA